MDGAAASGKLETLHCSQQPLIVLLVPYQGQNMPGHLFNHITWPLVGVWAAFLWAQPAVFASYPGSLSPKVAKHGLRAK